MGAVRYRLHGGRQWGLLDLTYRHRHEEEVGDGITTLKNYVASTFRKQYAAPVQDRQLMRPHEQTRSTDDKITALKNYWRAKGLCFTCGEKWSRDHKCQATVQLHVVQELVEFFQPSATYDVVLPEDADDMGLMHIADLNSAKDNLEQSIVLNCIVQGAPVVFLLDSGSNSSFISTAIASQLDGHENLSQPRRVKVAGGGILQCIQHIPNCKWSYGNWEFYSAFKILPLQGYDGIVGMDWLSSHSPQIVDWQQKRLAFQIAGYWICLQGNLQSEFAC